MNRQDNRPDKTKTTRFQRGSLNPQTKLLPWQIAVILGASESIRKNNRYRLMSKGWKGKLAELLGVRNGTISDIIAGRRWPMQ